MVENESDARKAMLAGRTVKLTISSFDGTNRNLYLIPSSNIENEFRKGILISSEGRGSFFYDGQEQLKAIELVKNGFMPLDASRTIAALKKIFPELEEPIPTAMGNTQTKQLTYTRNEHCIKTKRPKRPTTRPKRPSTSKPAKSDKPAKPQRTPTSHEVGAVGLRGGRKKRCRNPEKDGGSKKRVGSGLLHHDG